LAKLSLRRVPTTLAHALTGSARDSGNGFRVCYLKPIASNGSLRNRLIADLRLL